MQRVENTGSFITIFPEEVCSWESFPLPVFSHCSVLTVGFRFGAAANPYRPASEGVYPDGKGWRAATLAPAMPMDYDRGHDPHGLPLA